jgi:hypothetical protein
MNSKRGKITTEKEFARRWVMQKTQTPETQAGQIVCPDLYPSTASLHVLASPFLIHFCFAATFPFLYPLTRPVESLALSSRFLLCFLHY